MEHYVTCGVTVAVMSAVGQSKSVPPSMFKWGNRQRRGNSLPPASTAGRQTIYLIALPRFPLRPSIDNSYLSNI